MEKKMKVLCDNEILKLGRMIRYNNRAKIVNESVAEHSLYVAFNVIKICKLYNISDSIKASTLEMAVVHDIPETYTGDVPFNVKKRSPELSEQLSKLELEFISENMPEIKESFEKFQEAERNMNIEGIIVKLADTLSVVQYCEQEKSLGNTSIDMMDILSDGYIRVGKYIELLEKKINPLQSLSAADLIASETTAGMVLMR